ncbi:MAG: hypothetical protein IPL10_01210 [Bacteroidetes bacterium]|nr:hypothetical protein [Bacteroidota bacterium]
MKTISVVLMNALFMILSLSSCKGQSKEQLNPNMDEKLSVLDTIHKPKINVKVNKEFDSKGNLMRYDSSYTYVYRGSNLAVNDSLFPFKSFFGNHPRDLFNESNNWFQNDSIFNNHFFEDDFFKRQDELNKLLFDRLYPRIDSLKHNYLNKPYAKPRNKTI